MALKTDLLGLIDQRVISLTRLLVQSRIGIKSYNEIKYLKVPTYEVALDLNETHTISLFGVQGGGKSYTLGTIAEMASLAIPHINALPRPLATIIFHYSPTQDY